MASGSSTANLPGSISGHPGPKARQRGRGFPVRVMNTAWALDERLAQDSVPVGDLALSRVLLAKDANYPWLILVPRRAGVTEIIDLAEADQAQLLAEIVAASRALKAVAECDKLNVAALGNVVAQLHVHVIARRHSDPAWPKPVWGAAPPAVYEERNLMGLLTALRQRLGTAG